MAFKNSEWSAIKIGDKVGAVCGPCERPADNAGFVESKVEDKWGRHITVRFPDRLEGCHGFTTVGIGWYFLGTPSDKELAKTLGFVPKKAA